MLKTQMDIRLNECQQYAQTLVHAECQKCDVLLGNVLISSDQQIRWMTDQCAQASNIYVQYDEWQHWHRVQTNALE